MPETAVKPRFRLADTVRCQCGKVGKWKSIQSHINWIKNGPCKPELVTLVPPEAIAAEQEAWKQEEARRRAEREQAETPAPPPPAPTPPAEPLPRPGTGSVVPPQPDRPTEPLVTRVTFDNFYEKWNAVFAYCRAEKGFTGNLGDWVNCILDAYFDMIGWTLGVYEGEPRVWLDEDRAA